MSPRSSGQKQFFARSDEVFEVVNALRELDQLWTLAVGLERPWHARIVGPTESLLAPGGGRLHLSVHKPPADLEGTPDSEVNLQEGGWIQLYIGKEDDAALEMSGLAFKSPNPSAARLFQRLKQQLMKRLTNGVFGCQGEARRRYADLAFSPGALALFRDGRTWRPAYGGHVHFEPDVDARQRAGMG